MSLVLTQLASDVARLCRAQLRDPTIVGEDGAGTMTFSFDPPLSVAEQATFDALVKQARSHVSGISPAEWQAIQPDIDGLITFQGLASPTLAQTVLAVKAQSRILRAILRS
jgi:hypothetical protein